MGVSGFLTTVKVSTIDSLTLSFYYLSTAFVQEVGNKLTTFLNLFSFLQDYSILFMHFVTFFLPLC